MTDNDEEAGRALAEALQFETQEWVAVFGHTGTPDGVLRLCYLVREPEVPNSLLQPGFEFTIGDGAPELTSDPGDICTYGTSRVRQSKLLAEIGA